MEESACDTPPPLIPEIEPVPIPPSLSPPHSSPLQNESLLSPSHQTMSPPPSPPPNTNLALIPYLECNPKPMTTVFPSRTPSSFVSKPLPTEFSSNAPHLRFLNLLVPNQRNPNPKFIHHRFLLENLKG